MSEILTVVFDDEYMHRKIDESESDFKKRMDKLRIERDKRMSPEAKQRVHQLMEKLDAAENNLNNM